MISHTISWQRRFMYVTALLCSPWVFSKLSLDSYVHMVQITGNIALTCSQITWHTSVAHEAHNKFSYTCTLACLRKRILAYVYRLVKVSGLLVHACHNTQYYSVFTFTLAVFFLNCTVCSLVQKLYHHKGFKMLKLFKQEAL